MAEPASGTALTATLVLGLGMAAPLLIDGNALLGAALGATLIASTKKDIRWWQRLFSFVMAAGLGYILAPEVLAQTPINSMTFAAFVTSIGAIPLALKFSEWAEQVNMSALLREFIAGAAERLKSKGAGRNDQKGDDK